MVNKLMQYCFFHCVCFHCFFPKHCKIYLCGTKNDLIEANRGTRQVDFHDVQDFADGKPVSFVCVAHWCSLLIESLSKFR